MVELLALYLAGLSFFFSGMSGVSDNLRQMSGQRFRQALGRLTHRPVLAGLVGAALGAVTQSASVVAFILSGMVSSGLLPITRALIVLACANIGTALLVFFAASDLHLSILFLIGITGLVLAFKLAKRWKPAVASGMSVGLLFLGLEMMKQAFQPLASSAQFAHVAYFFARWPYAAFFLGTALRSFIHSSSAVAAIAVTINRGGQLGEFPSLMIIAGLGLGSAIATSLLSGNLRGVPRQIAMYQAMTNCAASLILAVVLVAERLLRLPLLIAALHAAGGSIPHRMACIYLVLNVTGALVAIGGLRWAPAWLAKLWPPTPEQDLSRPIYLQYDSLKSPETALDLVALEQMRIIRGVSRYLDAARRGDPSDLKPLHAAAALLGRHIAEFLDALLQMPIASDLATRAIGFQRKESTLRALEENAYLFSETLCGMAGHELAALLIESLDTILFTALAALESPGTLEIDMLVAMTDDRGGMMEELRNRHGLAQASSAGSLSALHYATTLFERNVWLLRQLALWMREDARLVVV
ncbi:MAG: Na/Pi symporter [Acidobacteriaceae bacterium]